MTRTREWLASPWLTVRMQIALGALFVAAAIPKIVDPPSFAQMIYNYRIVPGSLLNLSALVLPWFELLLGVALILGIWRRTAAAWTGILLVVFIVAIGVNFARGNAIDCGCFDVNAAPKTEAQKFDDMKWTIVRDVGMLLMVGQILYATSRRRQESARAVRLVESPSGA